MSIDVIKKVSDSLKSNVSAHVWSNQIVGTESILFAENSFASGIENIYSDWRYQKNNYSRKNNE